MTIAETDRPFDPPALPAGAFQYVREITEARSKIAEGVVFDGEVPDETKDRYFGAVACKFAEATEAPASRENVYQRLGRLVKEQLNIVLEEIGDPIIDSDPTTFAKDIELQSQLFEASPSDAAVTILRFYMSMGIEGFQSPDPLAD